MSNKQDKVNVIKQTLYIILICFIGASGIIFSVLYVDLFKSGFFYNYSTLIISFAVGIVTLLTVLTILFFKSNKEFIYKLLLLIIIFYLVIAFGLYLLKFFGFFDKIKSVDDFRVYIESFGSLAVVLFILLQFLQVVILPIPSFITVGAGVLLFGPLKGAIFSSIGIILGSFVGFYIGRIFGFKVAKWLVGEQNLKKGLELIKGKDKAILTFMFLFPFFPDDVLCFVAGITTISPSFFSIMIVVTRLIAVFVSSYSLNNSIIPYNTLWGVIVWILLFIGVILLTILIYKKGEIIEKKFQRSKNNNLKDKSDNV